jgi:tol-pal system protein YbgF
MELRIACRHLAAIPAAAFALSLVTGCVSHNSGNLKTEVEDLQNRLYELQKRNAEAQVEIQDLKEGSPGSTQASSGGQVAGYAEPGAASEEDIVAGSTVDMGDAGPSKSAEENEPPPYSGAPSEGQPPATGPAAKTGSAEIDKLYVDGYAQFNSGKYQAAQQEFGEFLARAPESDLADDAQYWIGECIFSQKDYRRAILEFRKVIDQYPFGNRVPHAFLKVGLCYLALGDRERASESLETVVQAFPRSEVATVAKATLDEIKKTSQR